MSFYGDITTEIKGKIATLKAVSDKVNKKISQSKSKANSLMDSIIEIFKQLGGYQDMIKSIENILSVKLNDIEDIIKSSIKTALKETISCGIEPSIGDLLIITGVTFDIGKIDPISILNIDPLSENGSYSYFDNLSGIESADFNVFLYTVIQKSISNPNYNGDNWYKITYDGTEKIKTELLRVSFKEYDVSSKKSNQLTIKISKNYKGEKLNFFISEYLDSVKLFNNVQIISSIFDEILGTKIISPNKTTDQILIDKTINNLVDNIINNAEDENEVIDDSYYTFSNDVYNELLEESEKKKNGTFSYNQNLNKNLSVDQDLIIESLNGLKQDNLLISQQTKILTDTIDAVAKDLSDKSNINKENEYSFKFDFISKIISKLMNIITLFIFTPKIIYLFVMTSKLYGLEDPDNIIDFIKKNINIYKLIIIKIRDIIMEELINQLKNLLAPMLATITLELAKEKFSIYIKQLKTITSII